MEARMETATNQLEESGPSGSEFVFSIAPTMSFAAEQSGVPLLRSATVRNYGPDVLMDGELVLQLEPDLCEPLRIALPNLPPLEEHDLGVIDLRLPPGKLRQVREAERASFTWSLRAGASEIASGVEDVQVLPFNQWPGLQAPPALLASFVTPNHTVITEILKRVGKRLEDATGRSAIDGYLSRDPSRVLAMARALYEEIASLDITYVGVPASFEARGQKVRLPDQVLAEQLGCCLDLSLLFASCLEQMGLAPLIVVVRGHAFPALWLVDDRFPEGLVEDASRMRNQLALEQIVAFESTLVTTGGNFDQALLAGAKRLQDDEAYLFSLDIRACRSEFRPLPLREVGVPVDEGEAPTPMRIEIVRILRDARSAPAENEEKPPPPEDVPTRFRRWQDRLLDLTLRNRLLNFRREGVEVLPLRIPDIGSFEDLLATGERLEIVGRPLLHGVDERDVRLDAARGSDELERARLLEDLDRRIVHSRLPQDRLEQQAVGLIRAARTDLEEGGASTLFATIGMLKWIEPGKGTIRFAPILLYPVELTLDRRRHRVVVRRLSDEDPVANVTLIEKFRRDLGIDLSALALLDQDEAGLDVPKLLDGVRREIQARAGFEVLNEAHIARLSFSKFLMWKDLEDNAPLLLENPVVRHIAGASGTWEDQVGKIEPRSLDDTHAPHALPTVLDADSTQLAAMAAALEGRSFVLQGPPGTGKSQTITNLIAAAVAAGRSVLFVSEKMAALEVVHRRLEEVGLGDFCLELHSHKSSKKEVLSSFAAVLERQERTRVPEWKRESERLAQLRDRLNEYARALHREYPSGFSPYQARARLRELLAAPDIRIPLEDPGGLTAERIRELQDAAEAVADRGQAVEPFPENPWRASQTTSYSALEEEKLADALEQTLSACGATQQVAERLEELLGLHAPRSIQGLRQLASLGAAAAEGAFPEEAVRTEWPALAKRARAWLAAEEARRHEQEALSRRWKSGLWELDLDALHARYQRWAKAFFLFAWLFLFGARQQLAPLARGKLGERKKVSEDLGRALAVKQEAARLQAERTELEALLDSSLLERGEVLHTASLLPSESRREIASRSSTLSAERRALLKERAAELHACLDRLERGERTVRELAQIAPGSAWPLADAPQQIEHLEAALRELLAELTRYRSNCLYREAAQKLESLGQSALIEAFETGKLHADQIPASLERNLLARWLSAVTDSEPALRSFDRPSQERLTSEFVELDRRHLELSRAYVIARVEGRLPAPGAPAVGELQLLRREIGKKSRHMAVRRLLQSLPELLPRLKPCLLMSPLSVAQYLPPSVRFDLLIFDEASQIGTHDAIGALARGKQVVVVGDSKQLPPTMFFQRSGADEEDPPDDNDIAELESILEEALARGLPQQMLGWHYRSRHDSLIEFSNRHYYDDRLFIFPAARHGADDLGVRWHHVPDGVYLSGRDRFNQEEATALVGYLVAQLRARTPEDRSFGVVTFSLAQRRLIEDLLDEARSKYPEIEAHFSSNEPVFVKNLENVQGDERDEILFSVGYAKDENGRLRMHFGPLSAKGGERRLNVAITRARCQLRVFSTLRPEEIDLRRTSAVGAAHLRSFLQFAARREAQRGTNAKYFESSFHREIHDALVEAGYNVGTSVGCAGYRIDLAIERPGAPGTFAVGIELDGPRWARAETARDRERLRTEVLQSLGWRMVRVWTPAWARESGGETRRLLHEIETALKAPSGPPRQVSLPKVEVRSAPTGRVQGPKTRPWKRTPFVVLGGREDFLNAGAKIQRRMEEIVQNEGPIHRNELGERVGEAWQIQRIGSRISEVIERHIEALLASGAIVMRGDFLWPKNLEPQAHDFIRLNEENGSSRPLEYFPPEEIALAAAWIRQEKGSLPEPELAREIARFLGAQRPSQRMVELILRRLEQARATASGL